MVAEVLPRHTLVQFYYKADLTDISCCMVQSPRRLSSGLLLLKSHGWVDGVLQSDFNPETFVREDKGTWPVVLPAKGVVFVDAQGRPARMSQFPVEHLRKTASAPLLSALFIRWGIPEETKTPSTAGWGKYGCPTSVEYMNGMVNHALLAHPAMQSPLRAEVWSLLVTTTPHLRAVAREAGLVASLLGGKRLVSIWNLYPAEWEDTGDKEFACYLDRRVLFLAQRACEAEGIQSVFPHPADLWELITSKSWMATLSLWPGAHLPAATMVSLGQARNAKQAAADALRALEHIRRLNPFPVEAGEPAAPSAINQNGVVRGVVKLGWSWENRFVIDFNGEEHLRSRLQEMLLVEEGLLASYCIVQEWVDFDFEMRGYFLPPLDWLPGTVLQPTKFECNVWGERDDTKMIGRNHASFTEVTEAACLDIWQQDTVAWLSAKEQVVEISQKLLRWLITAHAQPVPFVRLDFMLKRVGPGKARVFFGEFCEMGACCLDWQEGPPTIWRALMEWVVGGIPASFKHNAVEDLL